MTSRKKKQPPESVEALAEGLSEHQRKVLLDRHHDLLDTDTVGFRAAPRGPVSGALWRRGLIVGRWPHLRLTPLGEAVVKKIEAEHA